MNEDDYLVEDCFIYRDSLYLIEAMNLGTGLNFRKTYSAVSLGDIASSEMTDQGLIVRDNRSGVIKFRGTKEQLESFKNLIDTSIQPSTINNPAVDRSKLSQAIDLYIDTSGDYPSIAEGSNRLAEVFGDIATDEMSVVILEIFGMFDLGNKVDAKTALEKIRHHYPELTEQALSKVLTYLEFSGMIKEVGGDAADKFQEDMSVSSSLEKISKQQAIGIAVSIATTELLPTIGEIVLPRLDKTYPDGWMFGFTTSSGFDLTPPKHFVVTQNSEVFSVAQDREVIAGLVDKYGSVMSFVNYESRRPYESSLPLTRSLTIPFEEAKALVEKYMREKYGDRQDLTVRMETIVLDGKVFSIRTRDFDISKNEIDKLPDDLVFVTNKGEVSRYSVDEATKAINAYDDYNKSRENGLSGLSQEKTDNHKKSWLVKLSSDSIRDFVYADSQIEAAKIALEFGQNNPGGTAYYSQVVPRNNAKGQLASDGSMTKADKPAQVANIPNDVDLELLANWTFPGLTLYYRDTPLTQEQISKYRVGSYIKNSFFLDVSSLTGGLSGDTRYLIASSKAAPVYQTEGGGPDAARWKLSIINADSYYKVLDVYQVNNKTQILLLHIPKRWVDSIPEYTTQISQEERVIQAARQSFDEKLELQTLPELQEPEWKNRIQFPVGLDDNDLPSTMERSASLSSIPMYLVVKNLVNDMTGLDD